MLKTIDTISITVITLLLIFIWTYFIVGNIWWTIAISIAFYLLIWSIFKVVKMKKKDTYTPRKLSNHFALMGQSYTCKILFDNLKSGKKQLIDEKFVKIEDEIIYPLFKFSQIDYEAVASIYRLAKENNVKKVYMLSSPVKKEVVDLFKGLDVTFEFVSVDVFFNYLKKNNALPDIIENKEKPINKMGIIALFKGLISRNNTKYYVFSGILFAFISFISPNKVYYIVLSTIVFLLAILTFLPNLDKSNSASDSKTDFEKLLYKTPKNQNKNAENEGFNDKITNQKTQSANNQEEKENQRTPQNLDSAQNKQPKPNSKENSGAESKTKMQDKKENVTENNKPEQQDKFSTPNEMQTNSDNANSSANENDK